MALTDDRPLPSGWSKEWDATHKHFFYVDTQASPPRAIWVHPYEDAQFLAEHPAVREKIKGSSESTDKAVSSREKVQEPAPPAYQEAGGSNYASSSNLTAQAKKDKKGLLGKLKDKTLGTKEEREAAKREAAEKQERRRQRQAAEEELYRQKLERRRQREAAEEELYIQGLQQQQAAQAAQMQYQYGPPPGHYPGPGYPHQNGYYPQQVRVVEQQRGGGNMALPIVGGLLGGLILGDLLF